VAGRLTVKDTCTGRGGFVRQASSIDHFAIVTLEMVPKIETGEEVEIHWQSKDEVLKYEPDMGKSLFEGMLEAVKLLCYVPLEPDYKYYADKPLEQGALTSCSITIIDAQYNCVDSKPK